MYRWIRLSVIVGCCLGFGSLTRASGLFFTGHGVRGMGRASAYTAGGDDPSGIWYNPANIGGLNDLQILFDSSLVLMQMDYDRVDSGGNSLPTVSTRM